MEKERLGVIFGGMSTENEVSVVSANSVIKNLDREKYEIYPIYIDKNWIWYEYSDLQEERKLGEKVDKKNRISDLIGYLKKLDIFIYGNNRYVWIHNNTKHSSSNYGNCIFVS